MPVRGGLGVLGAFSGRWNCPGSAGCAAGRGPPSPGAFPSLENHTEWESLLQAMAVFFPFLRFLQMRMPLGQKKIIRGELSPGLGLGGERKNQSWFIPVSLVKGPDSKE